MRPLLLDDAFPLSLAAELRARGRAAVHVREAGLESASDEHLAARARDAVLVTATPGSGVAVAQQQPLTPVLQATVRASGDAERREVVHRFAHEMATQRVASRRYPR